MNSPETNPVPERQSNHEQNVQVVSELSFALEELRFGMRDLARDSILSYIDIYLPAQSEAVRAAVEAAKGLAVEGSLTTNYYIASESTYLKGMLPHRFPTPNRFQGVVIGFGEVPVPTARGPKLRACLEIDPLYTLLDKDLAKHYADRGWHVQLRHPFALETYQDTRLYLPVDSLDQRGLELVTY